MSIKNQQITSSKQFLNSISIIYYAILIGPLAFLLIQYFQVKETKLEFSNPENTFQYIVPIFALLGYFTGKHLYQSKIKELKNKDTLLEKLSSFQTGFVLKIILLEGPALLGIIAFSQEGNFYFLIIAGILLLIIALQKPSKLNIEALLNLSSAQRNQYNKPDQKLE